jgi:hypothetical protein
MQQAARLPPSDGRINRRARRDGWVSSPRMATAPEYAAPAETPFTAGPDRRSGARSYAVPFIVAVTGHRDLVPDEIPIIRSRVRDCLFSLRYEYPSRIIVVMSSLADGADRIVAEEALQLGMPLSVAVHQVEIAV